MEERNKTYYQINRNNITYTIATSLTRDKINIECTVQNSQIYENSLTKQELIKLSKYFQINHSLETIQVYLNSIIAQQKISINQGEEALSFNLILVNNDQISIPLLKRMNNSMSNYPYIKYSSSSQINLPSNQYNINPTPITRPITQSVPTYYNKNLNLNSIRLSPPINQIKSGEIKSMPTSAGSQYPRADNPISNVSKFSLEENKINKLESENKIIKIGQENLKNDIKRLMQEVSKLKEENQVLRTDHNSLTNENSVLKNDNDNYKNQIEIYKKQIEAMQNQYQTYNKDLEAVEAQNDQIRKMYENLESEYNQYKSQTEEVSKENEMLRGQIEELNNNFIVINKELENIRNENDVFKTDLEQQKKNLNEDMVNKLIEENKILKQKLQMQNQNQTQEYQQESEPEPEKKEEQDEREEEEVEEKGEIIHDMKELELITNKINKENKKIIINLLYKASADGDKASIFHDKCDGANSTIVLVETLNGKRFGGYTTCSWAGNCEDKNDPNAFIFSFDKMKTYDNIPGDEAIGCYPKFGPIFLGCQIKIFDNAFTKGGTTFEKELNFNTQEDYELTGGDRVFQIKEIEVYEVIMEPLSS